MGNLYLGDIHIETNAMYLGDVPLFELPIFIDDDGKEYYEADCHIFIANDKPVELPIPNIISLVFVAVDGVEKNYRREVKGKTFPDSTISAIFDWDNETSVDQNWFSDILQFGLNSETGERNQLKNGKSAFRSMEANPAAISNLDVSNVENMYGMFDESSFNKPIGEWDTSNVKNMRWVFADSPFNQDISEWDVSNVTEMSHIFYNSSFNQDIKDWDISNVTDMNGMFSDASDFNQDISKWDVSNVTNMSYMFSGSPFNQTIGKWNTSNVTNMQSMFSNTSDFNQDIGEWDVSSVLYMDYMFKDSSFNQNLSQWCVSNVTDIMILMQVQLIGYFLTPAQFGAPVLVEKTLTSQKGIHIKTHMRLLLMISQ